MINCNDCEFCEIDENGRKSFKCDPFSNVKEPECLQKHQIFRLDILIGTYHSMLRFQEKMAPMQDKIIDYVKREIDDIEDSESWKFTDEDYLPGDQEQN